MERSPASTVERTPSSFGWGKREGWLGGAAASFAFLVGSGWLGTLLAPAEFWAWLLLLFLAGGVSLLWSRVLPSRGRGAQPAWQGFAFAFGLLTLCLGSAYLAVLLWAFLFGVRS